MRSRPGPARLGEVGQGTILFLDEVHRFNIPAGRPAAVGRGGRPRVSGRRPRTPTSRSTPARSRSTVFGLEPLADATVSFSPGPSRDRRRASARTDLMVDDDARDHLGRRADGDARHLAHLARGRPDVAVEAGRDRISRPRPGGDGPRALRYGDDDRYDVLSAFIKRNRASIRTPGSTGWPGCSRPVRTPVSSPPPVILASEGRRPRGLQGPRRRRRGGVGGRVRRPAGGRA